MPSPFTAQLDFILDEVKDLAKRSRHEDWSDVISSIKATEIGTRATAAIVRATGRASEYTQQAEDIRLSKVGPLFKMRSLIGVVQALRIDLEAGYLKSFEELIHGELFGDFLDMAQHLVESGYKDPAAVLAGSSLEGHLRQLAKLVSVETTKTTQNGQEPKKADALNAELAKAGAYSVTDQKNVTAWLDLRNKAAHGKYTEYEKGQVSIMIDGIRNFITRVPA